MTHDQTVIVLAKAPVAGRVKTRLCPPLSLAQAAALAAAALRDTLDVVGEVPAVQRVLALDGDPARWAQPGFAVLAQSPGSLDERIAGAFSACRGRPTVLVGMDTPQLAAADIVAAFALMDDGADAVIGLARDGGYWLLGLVEAEPCAVLGVPMSVSHTGREQLARLDAMGLATAELRQLRDVDHYDDALAVAEEIPGSRFAAAVESVAPLLTAHHP